jgi:endonuclease/exonuclease/phosphatase family metal-dependent hydrolase
MKKNQLFILALSLTLWFSSAFAQTNPTAVSLPFSLTTQTSATLPAGVAVHKFSSIPTTRTLAPATGDLPNQGSSAALATGGWYHLSTDGIGLLASGTNAAGAVVVAINTTGLTNIQVSWLCKTIKNQSSRDNSIALQYRVGTSGNFTNVGTTSTYTSAGKVAVDVSPTYTETLPVGAENQAVVQVRWLYWESVSTSGSRDKISVDDISISGSTSSACNPPTGLAASSITTTTANISWAAASGASSYEYDVTTSSTAPSTGTNTASTSAAVNSLTPNTLYYAHVRTNCGSGVFSSWATNSFTTADTTSPEEDTVGFVFMTYNLLNYPGSTGSSREPNYRTIMNDVDPDIVVAQEILQSTGANNFLSNVLNYSASNYSLGTFVDSYDSDNALYYKSSKFQFISNTPITTDLRDINQFKLKHIASGDTLIIFSVHLKASNTSSDEAQRALEIDSLRKVTDAMPAGKYFLVCGDFNIYSSTESAYQKLISNGSNANGKFYDQVSMTGTWNNSSYAIHHTQSPRTTSFGGGATGGLDDRFDMILFSDAITQTGGFDIVASTYKAYGNDGQHYNQALNTPPYSMYSSTIASALHDASDHLPVVVKLQHTSSSPMVAIAPSNTNGTNTFDAPATTANSIATPTQNTFANALTVYPNPASETVFVTVNTTVSGPITLNLFDVAGKLINQFTLNNTNTGQTNTLNLAPLHLTNGVYVLQSQYIGSPIKIVIK